MDITLASLKVIIRLIMLFLPLIIILFLPLIIRWIEISSNYNKVKDKRIDSDKSKTEKMSDKWNWLADYRAKQKCYAKSSKREAQYKNKESVVTKFMLNLYNIFMISYIFIILVCLFAIIKLEEETLADIIKFSSTLAILVFGQYIILFSSLNRKYGLETVQGLLRKKGHYLWLRITLIFYAIMIFTQYIILPSLLKANFTNGIKENISYIVTAIVISMAVSSFMIAIKIVWDGIELADGEKTNQMMTRMVHEKLCYRDMFNEKFDLNLGGIYNILENLFNDFSNGQDMFSAIEDIQYTNMSNAVNKNEKSSKSAKNRAYWAYAIRNIIVGIVIFITKSLWPPYKNMQNSFGNYECLFLLLLVVAYIIFSYFTYSIRLVRENIITAIYLKQNYIYEIDNVKHYPECRDICRRKFNQYINSMLGMLVIFINAVECETEDKEYSNRIKKYIKNFCDEAIDLKDKNSSDKRQGYTYLPYILMLNYEKNKHMQALELKETNNKDKMTDIQFTNEESMDLENFVTEYHMTDIEIQFVNAITEHMKHMCGMKQIQNMKYMRKDNARIEYDKDYTC